MANIYIPLEMNALRTIHMGNESLTGALSGLDFPKMIRVSFLARRATVEFVYYIAKDERGVSEQVGRVTFVRGARTGRVLRIEVEMDEATNGEHTIEFALQNVGQASMPSAREFRQAGHYQMISDLAPFVQAELTDQLRREQHAH